MELYWIAVRGAAFVSALVLLCFVGCAEGPPPVSGRVERETLRSEVVGDDYLIEVRLPPRYADQPDVAYPVVLQLDGTNFGPEFAITAGYASALEASGDIPDVIVVGVGYPYDDPLTDPKRGRMRDYVIDSSAPRPARGDLFLTFLETELIPWLDARYRIDPGQRFLSGHSLGGFFALHVMLTRGADPEPLFAGYIAGDPSLSYDDLLLFREEQALRERGATLDAKLYFPIARYDGAGHRLAFDQLGADLRRDFPGLTLEDAVYETDHLGVIAPGFEDGLLFLLGGAP